MTKRQVLSDLAKIYDSMGWFAPAILPAKLLIKELWSHQLKWDDNIPESILKDWTSWARNTFC